MVLLFFIWWLMSYYSLCLLNIKKLLIINSFLLFGCVSHVATLAAHEYGPPYFHQVCCDFVVLLSCRGFAKTVGGILAYIYLLLLLCIMERKS